MRCSETNLNSPGQKMHTGGIGLLSMSQLEPETSGEKQTVQHLLVKKLRQNEVRLGAELHR